MWFKKRKKKNYVNYLREVSFFSIMVGVILVIFPAIASFIGFSAWQNNLQLADGGMTLFMLGIALLALYFSINSDEKMKHVESMNVRRMIDEFLDRRLMLHERLLSNKRTVNFAKDNKIEKENELLLYKSKSDFEIYYIFSVWVCLRYLRKINKFRERLNSNNQKVIIKDTSILFDDFNWGLDFIRENIDKKYKIDPEYKDQINQIFDIVSNFPEFENSKFKTNIVKKRNLLRSDK